METHEEFFEEIAEPILTIINIIEDMSATGRDTDVRKLREAIRLLTFKAKHSKKKEEEDGKENIIAWKKQNEERDYQTLIDAINSIVKIRMILQNETLAENNKIKQVRAEVLNFESKSGIDF